jgi:hypothetical protein
VAIGMRSTGLGAGLGAGLMFLFDPTRGGRRRALLRDKIAKATHKTRRAYCGARRYVDDRLGGMAAMARSRMRRDRADDSVIEARVRAGLGHLASHPRSIEVRATNGIVTLSGDTLASEARAIDVEARRVRGVARVLNYLTVHTIAGRVPALPDDSSTVATSSRVSQRRPTPTMMMAGMGMMASIAAAAIAFRKSWPVSMASGS